MDVKCEKCGTIYELEDDRIGDKGVTVKCTQCGHLFRVVRKTPTAARLPAMGAGAPADKAQAQPKQWFIRKRTGEIFRFRELTTLQQWIVQEKVTAEDEISRTGKTWEKLGAIEELKPFFMVVEQARVARQAQVAYQKTEPDLGHTGPKAAVSDASGPSAVAAGPEEDEELPTSEMPAASEPRYELGRLPEMEDRGPVELGGGPRPATSDTGGLSALRQATLPDDDVEFKVRRKGSWAWILALGALAAVAAAVVFFQWDAIVGLFAEKAKPSRPKDPLAEPRRLVRQDTQPAFEKAFALLDTLYESERLPEARALQGEILALQAIYAVFQAQDLEGLAKKRKEAANALEQETEKETGARKTGRRTKKPTARTVLPQAEKLRKQAEELEKQAAALRNQASKLADRALAYAKEALAAKPSGPTERAMALALLAKTGPVPEAKAHLAKALRLGATDSDTLAAQAVFELLEGRWRDAEATIRGVLETESGDAGFPFRLHYLLARALAKQGKAQEANREIQAILAENPGHVPSAKLREFLERAKTIRTEEKALAAAQPGRPAPAETQPDSREGPAGSPGEPPEERSYDALVRKGDRYSENGRVLQAKRAYEKALSLNPRGVEALTGLAYCYLDLGQRGRAIATFKRALRQSPGFGDALIGLAETYKGMGNYAQALKYYKKYLDEHPGGRKAGLARRNVEELEDKLKPAQPETQPAAPQPPAQPSQPAPAPPGAPATQPPTPRPPETRPAPPADTRPAPPTQPRPETRPAPRPETPRPRPAEEPRPARPADNSNG